MSNKIPKQLDATFRLLEVAKDLEVMATKFVTKAPEDKDFVELGELISDLIKVRGTFASVQACKNSLERES